jgi:hypothetical protein
MSRRYHGAGTPAARVRGVARELPIWNYDALGAREVMRGLLDLPPEALRQVRAYEVTHARRSQVLAAIGRALARATRPVAPAGVPTTTRSR